MSAADWQHLTARFQAHGLSPLGAGILAAAALHLARDSRAFARETGIAHALVLRECALLAEAGWLHPAQAAPRLPLRLTPRALSAAEPVTALVTRP